MKTDFEKLNKNVYAKENKMDYVLHLVIKGGKIFKKNFKMNLNDFKRDHMKGEMESFFFIY